MLRCLDAQSCILHPLKILLDVLEYTVSECSGGVLVHKASHPRYTCNFVATTLLYSKHVSNPSSRSVRITCQFCLHSEVHKMTSLSLSFFGPIHGILRTLLPQCKKSFFILTHLQPRIVALHFRHHALFERLMQPFPLLLRIFVVLHSY